MLPRMMRYINCIFTLEVVDRPLRPDLHYRHAYWQGTVNQTVTIPVSISTIYLFCSDHGVYLLQ